MALMQDSAGRANCAELVGVERRCARRAVTTRVGRDLCRQHATLTDARDLRAGAAAQEFHARMQKLRRDEAWLAACERYVTSLKAMDLSPQCELDLSDAVIAAQADYERATGGQP